MDRGKYCGKCNLAIAVADPDRKVLEDGNEVHYSCVGQRAKGSVFARRTAPVATTPVRANLRAVPSGKSNGVSAR